MATPLAAKIESSFESSVMEMQVEGAMMSQHLVHRTPPRVPPKPTSRSPPSYLSKVTGGRQQSPSPVRHVKGPSPAPVRYAERLCYVGSLWWCTKEFRGHFGGCEFFWGGFISSCWCHAPATSSSRLLVGKRPRFDFLTLPLCRCACRSVSPSARPSVSPIRHVKSPIVTRKQVRRAHPTSGKGFLKDLRVVRKQMEADAAVRVVAGVDVVRGAAALEARRLLRPSGLRRRRRAAGGPTVGATSHHHCRQRGQAFEGGGAWTLDHLPRRLGRTVSKAVRRLALFPQAEQASQAGRSVAVATVVAAVDQARVRRGPSDAAEQVAGFAVLVWCVSLSFFVHFV